MGPNLPIKGFKKSHCLRGHLRETSGPCKICQKARSHNPEDSCHKIKRNRRLQEIKTQVLSYYGKDKHLHCSWPDCIETDLDVLTLDHIANDGYKDRNGNKDATKLYARLIREQFPVGFQTLCANHQLKKELLRRRSLLEVPTHADRK